MCRNAGKPGSREARRPETPGTLKMIVRDANGGKYSWERIKCLFQ